MAHQADLKLCGIEPHAVVLSTSLDLDAVQAHRVHRAAARWTRGGPVALCDRNERELPTHTRRKHGHQHLREHRLEDPLAKARGARAHAAGILEADSAPRTRLEALAIGHARYYHEDAPA